MRNIRSLLVTGAAVGAAAIGGATIASAATSTTSWNSASAASHASPALVRGAPPFNGPGPGTAAHENAEKPVTGTAAVKARAAAVQAAGGGTAGAVTSNFSGSGYEVTVTKSNRSKVEVHLNGSFKPVGGAGAQAGYLR